MREFEDEDEDDLMEVAGGGVLFILRVGYWIWKLLEMRFFFFWGFG